MSVERLNAIITLCLIGFSLLVVFPALAHDGEKLTPSTFLHHWNLDPLTIAILLATIWLYWHGALNLWRRVGFGRGVKSWQAGCYLGGVLILCLALISPIDLLGEQLFSAHMIQHMLLSIGAAPAIALGSPLLAVLWAFPAQRKRFGRLRRMPVIRFAAAIASSALGLWILHVGVLWLWHIPALYEAALKYPIIHLMEHASFLLAASLFWWNVLHTRQIGLAVLSLFTAMIGGGLLGALITFAPSAWYPSHAAYTALWELTPLEDQQLAGVIMWIPMSIIYVAATLTRIAELLRETHSLERRSTSLTNGSSGATYRTASHSGSANTGMSI